MAADDSRVAWCIVVAAGLRCLLEGVGEWCSIMDLWDFIVRVVKSGCSSLFSCSFSSSSFCYHYRIISWFVIFVKVAGIVSGREREKEGGRNGVCVLGEGQSWGFYLTSLEFLGSIVLHRLMSVECRRLRSVKYTV